MHRTNERDRTALPPLCKQWVAGRERNWKEDTFLRLDRLAAATTSFSFAFLFRRPFGSLTSFPLFSRPLSPSSANCQTRPDPTQAYFFPFSFAPNGRAANPSLVLHFSLPFAPSVPAGRYGENGKRKKGKEEEHLRPPGERRRKMGGRTLSHLSPNMSLKVLNWRKYKKKRSLQSGQCSGLLSLSSCRNTYLCK